MPRTACAVTYAARPILPRHRHRHDMRPCSGLHARGHPPHALQPHASMRRPPCSGALVSGTPHSVILMLTHPCTDAPYAHAPKKKPPRNHPPRHVRPPDDAGACACVSARGAHAQKRPAATCAISSARGCCARSPAHGKDLHCWSLQGTQAVKLFSPLEWIHDEHVRSEIL